MSADNTIAVAEFSDGFRVGETTMSLILDLDDCKSCTNRKRIINRIFGKSKIYPDKESALEKAAKIYDDNFYTEYGITILGRLEDFKRIQ